VTKTITVPGEYGHDETYTVTMPAPTGYSNSILTPGAAKPTGYPSHSIKPSGAKPTGYPSHSIETPSAKPTGYYPTSESSKATPSSYWVSSVPTPSPTGYGYGYN
jgi:hypothetical protein